MAEKNTYVDFELEDGSTVKLTLQFYRLYMLKNTNKKASPLPFCVAEMLF